MSLLAGPQLVDVVLLVLGLEAFALVAYRRLKGSGPRAIDLLAMLLPGALLLAALRAALLPDGQRWIMLLLTAALFAHLFDLSRRWSRPGADGSRNLKA